MSSGSRPDFDELIGGAPPTERERLRNAHELLIQAGPPPELSPELEQVPWPEEALTPLGLTRRRRQGGRPWLVYATAAAALVLVGFLIGQLGGSKATSFNVQRTVKMHGVGPDKSAVAAIDVGRVGADGNWPMLVNISNLRPARNGSYYDLWLSKNGKPVFLCGSFNTRSDADTVVRLSAAYPIEKGEIDGWIVTVHARGTPERNARLVMTT